MAANSVVNYLSKLLNRPLDTDTPLRLTSAQRARFNAWLHSQGVERNEAVLTGEFTVVQLIGGQSLLKRTSNAGSSPSSYPSTSSSSMLDVGIDIQAIDELMAGVANRDDFKGDPELLRLFTMRELSYAQSRPGPSETLAGLFAAKEAMRKCLGGASIDAEAFRALEVLPDEYGRPVAAGFSLSISHSGNFAIAVANRVRTVEKMEPVSDMPGAISVGLSQSSAQHWMRPLIAVSLLVLLPFLGLLVYKQLA